MNVQDFNNPPAPLETQNDWGEKLHYYWYLSKVLLKKYYWILILTTAIGVAHQGYKSMTSIPTFVSSARIMLSGFVANSMDSGIQENFGYWFGNQRILLENFTVRRAAEQRVRAFNPDIAPSGVNVSAEHIPETAVVQIVARGDSKEYTQKYLDALIEEYMNFRQQMKGETSERALLAITERIDELETQISLQEDAVVDFRKENNLIYIQQQGDVAGSNLARMKNLRAEMKTQLRLLETVGTDLDLASSDALGMETPLLNSEAEASWRRTQKEVESLKAQLREFSIYLKPRHPKIIQLKNEIQRSENLLGIYKAQALEQIEGRIAQLGAQMQNLDIVISEQESVALDNSRLAAEFERLNSNLTRSRNLYENLLRSIQTLETGQQIDPEIVRVIDGASPPYEIKESLNASLAKGFLGGFILGVGILALISVLDSKILTADDLKRHFNFSLSAIIPMENTEGDEPVKLLEAKDSRHLFSEACRTLRSSLFFMGDAKNRPQVVIVTSSIPSEGKSTISSNLAAAISFTSSKTILIDGDLRRGKLAKSMGYQVEPGLSDILQKGRRLESVIQKTSHDNLDFISTGEYPERPGELLLSTRMEEIISELRASYDYIIIDSAPILATDDTTGFSTLADSVLFVVRSGYTQTRQVKNAVDRIRMRGSKMSGFVLNCVDVKGTDYYYYKKYNDYYSYGPR